MLRTFTSEHRHKMFHSGLNLNLNLAHHHHQPMLLENSFFSSIPSIDTIFLDLDKQQQQETKEESTAKEISLTEQHSTTKPYDMNSFFDMALKPTHSATSELEPQQVESHRETGKSEEFWRFSFSNADMEAAYSERQQHTQSGDPLFSSSSSVESPFSTSDKAPTNSQDSQLEEMKCSPDEAAIANMTHKEFTALLTAAEPSEKTRLRKIRRLMKNRNYAKTFRRKQQILSQTFSRVNAEKESYIEQLQNALQRMKDERDFYKVKVEILMALSAQGEEDPCGLCPCPNPMAQRPLM